MHETGAEILSPTPEHIERCAVAIKRGDVVGMPTETVYGLAGNAFDATALTRIFSVKERPTFDPLIVHVAPKTAATLADLESQQLVDSGKLSPLARLRAECLMRAFWPGPLTLVLPKHVRVPDLATSGLPSVGVRMPAHPIAQALIQAAGVPLAAPSANRFGRISPTRAEDVRDELGDRISLILDGGASTVGLESSVVGVSFDGTLTLLRPGGISREKLEQIAGVALLSGLGLAQGGAEQALEPASGALLSPGTLLSHYAPRKPLYLLSASVTELVKSPNLPGNLAKSAKFGLIVFAPDTLQAAAFPLAHSASAAAKAELFAKLTGHPVIVRTLSSQMEQAARALFATLREIDGSEAEILFAEPCPSREGLGHAIADRLMRAAVRG